MNIRSLNSPHIWDCLSRTRSLPPGSITTRANDRRNKSNVLCHPKFGYLIYQGLGVTGPLGLCYVVGVVVGGIGGEGITLALVLASVTSILTGLCYVELLSSSPSCSGNGITAVYQLVGEFPAFLLALYSFTISCCSFAALSKALSATIEELSHRKLSSFLSSALGTMPLSELPPDLFAAGTAITASVLLACGLKQAGFLRTAMNILCICGFTFFVIIGSFHTRTNASKVEENPPQHRQILAGAGILCCLFFQFLELGRRSKAAEVNTRTKLPLAITFACGGAFIVALALAILLPLMMDNRSPVSGAPLLRAFQLRDIDWARFTMGSLQVIILSLGVSEAGEAITRQIVAIASNGFIPSFLSKECSTSFTHAWAHLVGGIWVGTLAMFLTHVYLLELMAANILFANTLITFIVLYRPHRSAYDSLCTVNATHASKACIQLPVFKNIPKILKKDQNNHTSNQFRKTRLPLANFLSKTAEIKIRNEESAVPLLSPLQFSDESGMESDEDQTHVMSEEDNSLNYNISRKVRPKESTTVGDGTLPSPFNVETVILSAPEVATETTLENDSEEVSSDEDIDTIVAEYKEKLRVSTSGPKICIAPTGVTAKKALLLTTGISLTTFFIFLYSLTESEYNDLFSTTFRNVFVTVMCIVDLILMLLLWSLPTIRKSISSFNIPLSPLVQFVTLALNTLLFTELLTRTQWTVIPLHTIGILWYIFYASKNSVASKKGKDKLSSSTERRPREFIRLLPLIPATVITSRPQKNLTTEPYRNRLIL